MLKVNVAFFYSIINAAPEVWLKSNTFRTCLNEKNDAC